MVIIKVSLVQGTVSIFVFNREEDSFKRSAFKA